jgi:CheY-like chemotaxis protein
MKRIPCAYHPTTAVFVDDDTEFIEDILEELPTSDFSHLYFSDPVVALDHINNQCDPGLFERGLFKRNEDEEGFEQRILSIELGDIHKEIYNTRRFARISTVVADFQMSGLNGLELCSQLNSPYLKKILLTNVADEGLAIHGGLPGVDDWEWAIGTNTNSQQHSVSQDLGWISGKRYAWTIAYTSTGSATLTVSDAGVVLFSKSFVPSSAPGMRSGTAVRMSASLNNSAPDTPILATIDRVNGAPATAVLNLGVAAQRDGSVVVYFPGMATGAQIEGTVQISFVGSAPPERKKLSVDVNAGAVACRPELGP